MGTAPDLSATIATAAEDPARANIDGQDVQSRPLPELIAADKYLASKAAASGGKPRQALRMTRLIPPGAV